MTDGAFMQRLHSRAYWRVVIQPETFRETRIQRYSALKPLVEQAAVSLRGWDFPHVDHRPEATRRGADWYGETIEWQHFVESWRLYQSGLFAYLGGLNSDWIDRHGGNYADRIEPLTQVGLIDAIYRYTEFFEFAARLALTDAGDDRMRIAAAIVGIQDRELVVEDPRRMTLWRRTTPLQEFEHDVTVERTDLVARPRELAIDAVVALVDRFGAPISTAVIEEIQGQLGRR